MFGYVLANKPELKIKDFELYRSYYCGLCRSIKARHGNIARMTLNYDFTFLLMLLSDLYDEKDMEECKRCAIHPVHKHTSRRNAVTDYCSDMCVLLSYYKCLDDWKDEKRLNAKIYSALLKRKRDKIEATYPQKADIIKNRLNMLSIVESSDAAHLDKAAKIFGELMGGLFVYREDIWKDDLYRIGFYLGKFIYYLDAYGDIERDLKNGSYNPFKEMYSKCEPQDFEEQVLRLLLLMIGECTDAFERLPLVENVEILRNILYSGVWTRFNAKGEHKKPSEGKGEETDGPV